MSVFAVASKRLTKTGIIATAAFITQHIIAMLGLCALSLSFTLGPLLPRAGMAIKMQTAPDFSYDNAPATKNAEALEKEKAEVEAAAAEVMAAAEVFNSEQTTAYARSWTRRLMDKGSVVDQSDFTVCDECLENPYSPECERLEEAIKSMQLRVNSDWAGTAS